MIQDPTGGIERNVLNNWAPPCPVQCSCTAFLIYVTLHSVVHTERYEHDEVTVNSWHVYVPLGHLAERTRQNQRQWLVRTFPVARNKMKYIVAKIYVKVNYSMTPFALDIRKWDASGLCNCHKVSYFTFIRLEHHICLTHSWENDVTKYPSTRLNTG